MIYTVFHELRKLTLMRVSVNNASFLVLGFSETPLKPEEGSGISKMLASDHVTRNLGLGSMATV